MLFFVFFIKFLIFTVPLLISVAYFTLPEWKILAAIQRYQFNVGAFFQKFFSVAFAFFLILPTPVECAKKKNSWKNFFFGPRPDCNEPLEGYQFLTYFQRYTENVVRLKSEQDSVHSEIAAGAQNVSLKKEFFYSTPTHERSTNLSTVNAPVTSLSLLFKSVSNFEKESTNGQFSIFRRDTNLAYSKNDLTVAPFGNFFQNILKKISPEPPTTLGIVVLPIKSEENFYGATNFPGLQAVLTQQSAQVSADFSSPVLKSTLIVNETVCLSKTVCCETSSTEIIVTSSTLFTKSIATVSDNFFLCSTLEQPLIWLSLNSFLLSWFLCLLLIVIHLFFKDFLLNFWVKIFF